jgi:4-hydroxybenzoate polyprenyltransferase
MLRFYTPAQLDVPFREREGNRWWIYQEERFPFAAYAPVVAAFSFAAVAYSALARASLPGYRQIVAAFGASFLFFLQLRLADDFKDFADDSRCRPYRPVPRGLVKQWEVAYAWAGCLVLQLLLALSLSWRLLPLLGITSAYMLIMSNKHLVRVLGLENWVKRHAALYRATGPVIVALIFLYASACDWVVAGYFIPPGGLVSIIAANYFSGMVMEIGRKIRVPDDEEHGVETYSILWGRRKAVLAWLAVMTAAAVAAYIAGYNIHYPQALASLMVLVLIASVIAAVVFLAHSKTGQGRWIEAMSRIWALVMYLSLGALPVLLLAYGGQR